MLLVEQRSWKLLGGILLGNCLGRPDLRLDPVIRLFVTADRDPGSSIFPELDDRYGSLYVPIGPVTHRLGRRRIESTETRKFVSRDCTKCEV